MDKMIIVGGRMSGKNQKTIESISKDFEKKGCPMDIAFRALEEGIYTKEYGDDIEHHDVRALNMNGLEVISNICCYAECDSTCEYSEYKKTWWLKEDKSE